MIVEQEDVIKLRHAATKFGWPINIVPTADREDYVTSGWIEISRRDYSDWGVFCEMTKPNRHNP